MFISLLSIVILLAVVCWWQRKKPVPKGLKALPGPKGLPVIGSVHRIPTKLNWIKFADWGKQYGPIYQVNLAGHNHVWISSDSVARELLSKRASIYSDRPHIPALIDDNRYSGQYLPLMSKSESWTRQRKFANHIMRISENQSFFNHPELESVRLCHELLHDPRGYNTHLESFVSRVTCRLAWGHAEASDELKQRARELLIGVSPTGAFGNKIPFAMSLPDWMSPPKAWERRRAKTERKWFQIMQDSVRHDLTGSETNCAKNQDSSGTRESWMQMYLDKPSAFGFKDDVEGAYAVGMHGIAGALTIAAPMQSFCLAMSHFPQFLPILHEELDRVCPNRLPTFQDKAELPVLRACIREVLRWRPPVPTGIPHYLVKDDEYEGYFVPKGSIVHPLEWAISRDPELFPDAEAFNPLRWLRPEYPTYKEPLSHYPVLRNITQYGYGHRTCQGQGVAEADLIVALGALAWLFDIKSLATSTTNAKPASTTGKDKGVELSAEMHHTDRAQMLPMPMLTIVQRLKQTVGRRVAQMLGDTKSKPLATRKVHEGTDVEELQKEKQDEEEEVEAQEDKTLVFTTLLIAKPLPFEFELKVRNSERAQMVEELFEQHRTRGDFPGNQEYWGENHGEGREFGWVKV